VIAVVCGVGRVVIVGSCYGLNVTMLATSVFHTPLLFTIILDRQYVSTARDCSKDYSGKGYNAKASESSSIKLFVCFNLLELNCRLMI
jgi:hypothetical protein